MTTKQANYEVVRITQGWFPTEGNSPFRPFPAGVKLPGKPSSLNCRQVGKMEAEAFLWFLISYLKDQEVWEEVEMATFWNAFMKSAYANASAIYTTEGRAIYFAKLTLRDAQDGFCFLVEHNLIVTDHSNLWFHLSSRLIEYLLKEPHPLDCLG